MHTHIIYRKRLFVAWIGYLIFFGALDIISLYLIKDRLLTVIFLAFIVLPAFFIWLLLKPFTKRILIELGSDSFSIKMLKNGQDTEDLFSLNEISSYCIQFPTDKFSGIKFKLNNGKSYEYSFYQKKKRDDDVDTWQIINVFHNYIRNYNEQGSHKIMFVPAFYATRKGLLVIALLSAFLLFAIIFVSFMKGESSLPITFIFSFILILQLILKRRKELNYYKEMINSN